jgi:hypothetical protein
MAASSFFILATLLLGGYLIKRGRWPNRVGDTPHCGNCNYILTGLDSVKCPECGREVTPGKVVYGERKTRTGLVLLGGFLILLGCVLGGIVASGVVDRIDWYHYRPTAWVFNDLDSPLQTASDRAWMELLGRSKAGTLSASQQDRLTERTITDLDARSQATRERGWTELQIRLSANRLSAAQKDRLTERALSEQISSVTTSITDPLMTYLGKRWSDRAMSPAQEQRFFDGCSALSLTARPQVGSADDVPYVVLHGGRGPSGWGDEITTEAIEVDGRSAGYAGGITSGDLGGTSTFGSTLGKQPIGHHHLAVKVRIRLGKWNPPAPLAPIFHEEKKSLPVDFDVLTTQPTIASVSAPDAVSLSKSISIYSFQWDRSQNYQLRGQVDIHGAPVNVAFDAFARIDGKEYSLGWVALAQGKQCSFGVVSGGELPRVSAKSFDLILRSSESAARKTVDLNQIWRGEIVVPNVPLQPSTPGTR